MLPWKLRKCQILPVNQNLSSVYFSLAKFQLVSCNPSLAMIWQMTYTHKLPKLCSATLSLSLNSERNGIIILASKQRLLWRIAPEMFKAALEKLCFQAETYMYTAEKVPWTSLIPVFYKITKIVRALWLAERCVCMRVCKHMVVASRCFAFRALITQAWNIWKSFQVHNLTSLLYLPIPSSAETWKILTKKCVNFFSLKLTF